MSDNFPGPWQIRIFYSSGVTPNFHAHVQAINVDVDDPPVPGSDFTDYHLKSRQGLFYNAATFLAAYEALWADFFKTDAVASHAELWKYADASNDAAYQSSLTLGWNGAQGAAAVPDGEVILTFRSQNGGSGRLHFFEGVFPAGPSQLYPTSSTPVNDMFDFITDEQSPVIARDNGYLFSPLRYLPGLNEHLFKNRQRLV